MEATEIPTPPVDPLFYKWLAGVAVTALSAIFLYMAHGVIAGMKSLGQRLDEVEKEQIRQAAKNELKEKEIKGLEDRLVPIEERVFPVRYPAPGYRAEDWKV